MVKQSRPYSCQNVHTPQLVTREALWQRFGNPQGPLNATPIVHYDVTANALILSLSTFCAVDKVEDTGVYLSSLLPHTWKCRPFCFWLFGIVICFQKRMSLAASGARSCTINKGIFRNTQIGIACITMHGGYIKPTVLEIVLIYVHVFSLRIQWNKLKSLSRLSRLICTARLTLSFCVA